MSTSPVASMLRIILQNSIRRASDVVVCVFSSYAGAFALMRYTSPAFLTSPHFNPIIRPGHPVVYASDLRARELGANRNHASIFLMRSAAVE